MQLRGMASFFRWLFAGCIVLGGAGCVSIETEQSFPARQIRSIRPGTTSKQEILAWFGPPVGMARKGEHIRVPSVTNDAEEPSDLTFTDILKYFPTKHEESNLVIYLYQYWKSNIPSAHVAFAHLAEGQETVNRLWVLVDEDSGVAVDSVLRTREPRGVR
jgi:hypothetical protein